MADSGEEFTHIAYGYRRIGRKPGRLLECGVGRIDDDGRMHVYLDRTPFNFTGYVQVVPNGAMPELLADKPHRPDEAGDEPGRGEAGS
jgi:hypothetical protein